MTLLAAGFACHRSRPHPKKSTHAVATKTLPVDASVTVAQLTRARGDVRLQAAGQNSSQPSVQGLVYKLGDVVITGADGEATVVFGGKNEVTLAPNSTLLIGNDGGTQAQMGAVILRGSARAASSGTGAHLRIGTPGRMAEVGGAQRSVLDVSTTRGLKVEVGQVTLAAAGGTPAKTLTQGQVLAIDGLAIARQSTTIDGLAIAQQSTTIDGLTMPRQVTTVAGLTVPQQSTTVDGLTVPQQTTTVDGLTVPQQTTIVDGLTVPQQSTTVDGLNIADQGATTPANAGATPDDARLHAANEDQANEAPLTKGRKGRACVFVTARPHAAQAADTAQATMQPVVHRTALFAGGQVLAAKTGGANIRMGTAGWLHLSSQAHFMLKQPSEDGSHPSYAIDSGPCGLALTPRLGQQVAHTVELAHTVTEITAGVKTASVNLTPVADGVRVYLRYGRARVGPAVPIEAGQVFTVQDGQISQSPHPIEAPISIQPGRRVEIYTDGRPLPVKFLAPQEATPNGRLRVELARDRQFKQILAAEEVSRSSFGVDTLPARRLYYRLNQDAKTIGSVVLMPENQAACPQCQHASIVQDSGKKTILYYQETLPAIDVRWRAVANATQYHLKIFRDGNFDHAEVDEVLTTTQKSLPRGRLSEGHYYWLVTAQNKAGRNLSASPTNLLQISYDNVIQEMSIRSPNAGQKVSQDNVQTTGYVVLGSKLYINDVSIDVNEQGHFDETIQLRNGVSVLVYRTVGTDGKERFYSREVSRDEA